MIPLYIIFLGLFNNFNIIDVKQTIEKWWFVKIILMMGSWLPMTKLQRKLCYHLHKLNLNKEIEFTVPYLLWSSYCFFRDTSLRTKGVCCAKSFHTSSSYYYILFIQVLYTFYIPSPLARWPIYDLIFFHWICQWTIIIILFAYRTIHD